MEGHVDLPIFKCILQKGKKTNKTCELTKMTDGVYQTMDDKSPNN